MTTVNFAPKPDKTHITIDTFSKTPRFYMYAKCENYFVNRDAFDYCMKVNPDYYKTPGEAARALFNYKGDLCK